MGTDLTLRSVDSRALAEKEQIAECREMAGEAGRRAVIAIVDDDRGLRRALGRLLSAFDYSTETFGSAGEFLFAASTRKLACIVVDINLGDTSGLELVRQLSVSGLRFPTIFISGVEDKTIERRANELGCIAFLRKPFPADRLIEAVKMATGSTHPIESDRINRHVR